MGKVGGRRNFGFGKQLAYAGKMALANYYGEGHFSTRQSHTERWAQFACYLKQQGINDARKITKQQLQEYAIHLKQRVEQNKLSVAYAQNLLSSVNVVLQAMREDSQIKVSPANVIGKRSHIRQQAPSSYTPNTLQTAITQLEQNNHARIAAIVTLTRAFGLRIREACLLDMQQALSQALTYGKIRITRGTKGASGKGQQRWVPVLKHHVNVLKRVATLQQQQDNLIPSNLNFQQWQDHCRYHWQQATTDIKGFHDMRAAYACERYQQITGYPAPVVAGTRQVSKDTDKHARMIISQELGHHRIDVIAAYIGSSR